MYPGSPNPSKVQLVPPAKRMNPPVPLVLIHDGGGTVFSYFILGSLNREVWAVHNPNYFDGKVWEGGMDEMARHYIGLMETAGISGTILLGGWSLGGFLSVTIARMLADDPNAKISVAGMLLIDSPRHIARSKVTVPTSAPALSNLPDLVIKSFDNCDIILQDWDLPTWDGPTKEGKDVRVGVGGRSFTVNQNKVLYKPLRSPWKVIETKTFKHETVVENPKAPPPAVLMRCVRHVKKLVSDSTGPCLIDLHREKTLLGWEEDYPDFVKACIDVDADHYDIFDHLSHDKMKVLTNQVNEALQILDSINGPRFRRAPMEFY